MSELILTPTNINEPLAGAAERTGLRRAGLVTFGRTAAPGLACSITTELGSLVITGSN